MTPYDEVDPSEMVKGYRYGKEYVPMPSDMDGLLKISAPAAAIALLGTLQRRRYPHATSFMSDARGLAATDGDARAAAALAAISKALSLEGLIGVARFVPRKDATPEFVALVPDDGALLI